MSNKIQAHKDCALARGLHSFQCLHCKKDAMNYSNSIDICEDCAKELGICVICGRSMKNDNMGTVPERGKRAQLFSKDP